MKNNTITREATEEEIREYEQMEKPTGNRGDEEFAEVLDMFDNYFFSHGEARKAAYSKVYHFAKKLGVTVKTIDNWYFTEVC